MELRSLRKSAIELEEHSALLQNHVDNMESVVADLEQEVEKHFQDGLNLVHTLMRVQLKTKFTLEELVEKSKDCLN